MSKKPPRQGRDMDKGALLVSIDALDKWVILFGVLVATGVVGEAVAGYLHWRWGGELQAIQSDENLALQRDIERLRATNLALQKRTTPRSLSLDEQIKVSEKLSKALFAMKRYGGDARISAEVRYAPPSPEAISLGLQIHKSLLNAGFRIVELPNPGELITGADASRGLPGPVPRGIFVRAQSVSKDGKAIADMLAQALTESGLEGVQRIDADTSQKTLDKVGADRWNDADRLLADSIEVVVAERP